jgi:YtcA family
MKEGRLHSTGAKDFPRREVTWLSLALVSLSSALSGCRRSPTFNILGSFFPAWLVCMFAGILLAAVSNRVLAYFKLDREIAWSIVVYPCLALFFACALWLIFFS